MGITISYRGSLASRDRLEDFEDRVLDLALELGGQAQIWRSADHDRPERVTRGVILNLYPGQETISLLIAPEGWLIGLGDIEAAEQGQFDAPPWCFVKTQFGSIEGHVAVVEMLAALKREFLPDLEVRDEGGYWETRDLAALNEKMAHLRALIEAFGERLEQYGLTAEAAEDGEILLTRIERIAALVQQTLARPAEHPPVSWDDDEDGDEEGDDAGPESEARWDAMYKENRRTQERLQRAIEERLARGEDVESAFEEALSEETAYGLPDDPSDQSFCEDAEAEETDDEEPWRESLPAALRDAQDEFADGDPHPLLQRAQQLLLRLHELLASAEKTRTGGADALLRGAGEMLGGLAQALGGGADHAPSGLTIVQLKRALRGAAFAAGALFPLRAAEVIDERTVGELHAALRRMQSDIFAELRRCREKGNDLP